MKYISKDSMASDALKLKISNKKLSLLRGDLTGFGGVLKKLKSICSGKIDQKKYIKENIFYGDSQPAMVISVAPIRIAAYSDELDCIAMLQFPDFFREVYGLVVGKRLISINTYRSLPPFDEDLIIGEHNLENWYGFSPIIADFISDDIRTIEQRKQSVPEELWNYIHSLGADYYSNNPDTYRNGKPFYSRIPSRNGIKM